MKLKDNINTVISHNAHVSLDIKDKNEPWFSPSVYPRMVHAIFEKWHKYEFYPITDIINKSYRLYIKLKNFYY